MSLAETLRVEVSTGTDKQMSGAPAIVSVVTKEDIAAIGARTLSEALEHIPGLHVAPSINRLTPLFSIRGIFSDNTPQVLVLIDGNDISEMTALSTPYGFHYPTHFIERIEIIRGPGSAVYGADAFSGVINIITKQPSGQNSATANLRVGSFDTKEAWMNANFVNGELKGSLSISHQDHGSDNDRTTSYGVMKRDGDVSNLHLNLAFGNFSLKNWYWKSDQYMGVGAGIFGNDLDIDRSKSWRSQLSWQGELNEQWLGTVDVSYGQSDYNAYFQLFPPGVWPVGNDGNVFIPPFTPISFPDGVVGNPRAATKRSRLNTSAIYSGHEDHRVRLG
jgi:iron complex outermembrane receptor protein